MESIQLDQTDDGRSVIVTPGQQIVVRLPETRPPVTGGSRPRTSKSCRTIRLAGEMGIGAGGERVFTVVAGPRTGEARFALTRP